MSEPTVCLNCEARMPAGASACPRCGKRAGWTDTADDLSLPSFGPAVEPAAEPARPAESGAGTDPEQELQEELERQRQAPAGSNLWLGWTIVVIMALPIVSLLLRRARLGLTLLPISLILVVALLALYYFTQGRPLAAWEERRLYRQLLDRARGDRELAERVLDLERRRNPWATREDHLRAALYRWNRDHR